MSMASTTVRGAVTFLPSLLNRDHLKADEMEVVVVMVCVWCGGVGRREREKRA